MSDWWTYSLSDFLLFSPATYFRLIALHNLAVWPAPIAGGIAGAALLLLCRGPLIPRSALWLLALAWLASAGFLAFRYATVNWAAPWFALGFVLQGALTAFVGLGWRPAPRRDGPSAVLGGGLLLLGALAYPALALLSGRALAAVEIFAILPDPTVVATLGVLLLMPGRAPWLLLPLPLAWSMLGGATLVAMGAPEAVVLLTAGAAGLTGALRR